MTLLTTALFYISGLILIVSPLDMNLDSAAKSFLKSLSEEERELGEELVNVVSKIIEASSDIREQLKNTLFSPMFTDLIADLFQKPECEKFHSTMMMYDTLYSSLFNSGVVSRIRQSVEKEHPVDGGGINPKELVEILKRYVKLQETVNKYLSNDVLTGFYRDEFLKIKRLGDAVLKVQEISEIGKILDEKSASHGGGMGVIEGLLNVFLFRDYVIHKIIDDIKKES